VPQERSRAVCRLLGEPLYGLPGRRSTGQAEGHGGSSTWERQLPGGRSSYPTAPRPPSPGRASTDDIVAALRLAIERLLAEAEAVMSSGTSRLVKVDAGDMDAWRTYELSKLGDADTVRELAEQAATEDRMLISIHDGWGRCVLQNQVSQRRAKKTCAPGVGSRGDDRLRQWTAPPNFC
jgi:hypothetical protein